MYKCAAGEIKENSSAKGLASTFLFTFESSNTLVVDAGDPSKPLAIGALIKHKQSDKLFAHAGYPKGSPPPKFSRKKEMVFVPSTPEDARALTAAQAATRVRPMWMIAGQDNKLIPKGVVFVSTASIAAAAGDVEL